MFYSEYLSSPISVAYANWYYGFNPEIDLNRARAIGIYPLVQAPEGYQVAAYQKHDTYYEAVPFQLTNAEVDAVRAFNTKSAEIDTLSNRVSGLESDNVVDDATDTALITLVASLAQRIQALEEDHQSMMNPQTTDIQTEETSTY